jgi:hypothetical protein
VVVEVARAIAVRIRWDGRLNEHIATYPTDKGVEALYMTQHPSPADEAAWEQTGAKLPRSRKLTLPFRRIAIGVSFEPLFVTVIGERVFTHDQNVESVYLVIDEGLDTSHLTDLLPLVVALKDKHRASAVYCPSEPDDLLRALATTDGLARYAPPQLEQLARQAFPSFVNFELVASVVSRDLPDPDSIASALNDYLDQPVIDPRTNLPMVGADAEEVKKLVFMDDFPMFRTMHAVRTASEGGATACFLAISGLEKSAPLHQMANERKNDRLPVENRNPTGY